MHSLCVKSLVGVFLWRGGRATSGSSAVEQCYCQYRHKQLLLFCCGIFKCCCCCYYCCWYCCVVLLCNSNLSEVLDLKSIFWTTGETNKLWNFVLIQNVSKMTRVCLLCAKHFFFWKIVLAVMICWAHLQRFQNYIGFLIILVNFYKSKLLSNYETNFD